MLNSTFTVSILQFASHPSTHMMTVNNDSTVLTLLFTVLQKGHLCVDRMNWKYTIQIFRCWYVLVLRWLSFSADVCWIECSHRSDLEVLKMIQIDVDLMFSLTLLDLWNVFQPTEATSSRGLCTSAVLLIFFFMFCKSWWSFFSLTDPKCR